MSEPVSLGLDSGSTTTKLVGVDSQGRMVWSHIEPTHPLVEQQVRGLLNRLPSSIPVVATGYGRKLVPGAVKVVTEITCHARGVFSVMDSPGVLIDIGGQDSKVIRLGPGGRILDFLMNDKCAAGTGRFLESTAQRLRIPIEEAGTCALAAVSEQPISSTCTVFAESEIISLLARGIPLDQILKGLHRSLVKRVAALVGPLSPGDRVMLSGGVARNQAVVEMLGQELGRQIEVPAEPQLMGALGAALLGLEETRG